MSSGSQSMGAGATTVAVVGCGYWGKNLVRNFNELGALRMVCDPAPVQQALARQLAPEATVVSGLADVLASDVAGVVIATPAATHYEVAKVTMEAGTVRLLSAVGRAQEAQDCGIEGLLTTVLRTLR